MLLPVLKDKCRGTACSQTSMSKITSPIDDTMRNDQTYDEEGREERKRHAYQAIIYAKWMISFRGIRPLCKGAAPKRCYSKCSARQLSACLAFPYYKRPASVSFRLIEWSR